MNRRIFNLSLGLTVVSLILALGTGSQAEAYGRSAGIEPQAGTVAYLPLVTRPSVCPAASTNSYYSGIVYQQEYDWPVRPANAHADKNYALRGYILNTIDAKTLQTGVSDPNEPNKPPQLGTIFNPDRVTSASAGIVNVYRSYKWEWGTSPDPGYRNGEDPNPTVGSIGLSSTPGEVLQAPTSAYEIANVGGVRYQAFVMYADEDTIAIHYTAEDTAAVGYTVHVDNICTDPNLLALYNQLNNSSGPRYTHQMNFGDPLHSYSYNMPYLALGQAFGVARGTEVRVKIVDTGGTLDPRHCWNFWHWVAPNMSGACN